TGLHCLVKWQFSTGPRGPRLETPFPRSCFPERVGWGPLPQNPHHHSQFFISCHNNELNPFIRGVFQKVSPEKIAFFFNPDGLLRAPIKAVLFSSDFPDVPFNEQLLVSLSIRSPQKGGFSFPFLKEVKRRADGPQAFSEPACLILPDALLRDMYEDANFNITFGIGIPVNPY